MPIEPSTPFQLPSLPIPSDDGGEDSSLHHSNLRKRPYHDLIQSYYSMGDSMVVSTPTSKTNAVAIRAMSKVCKLFSDAFQMDENALVRMVNFVRPDVCLFINPNGNRCTKPAINNFCGYHKGCEDA